MEQEFRRVARVAKAHGSEGKVVCVGTDGLPLLVSEGLEVWVVPPTLRGPRHGLVTSVASGPAGALVALSMVRTRSDAESLAGRYLLARADALPEDVWLQDREAVLGLPVRDVALGFVGHVCDVLPGPQNDVWVLEGPYGEVLVPAVPQLLVELGPEGAVFSLPSGLVEGAS